MKGETLALIAGILCGIAGGCRVVQSWRRSSSWVRTDGVIVGLPEDEERVPYPKVQFQLPNGDEITFVSSLSATARECVGKRVRVLYQPEFPANAEILSFSRSWMLPIFLLGFGLVFTVVGILFLLGIVG